MARLDEQNDKTKVKIKPIKITSIPIKIIKQLLDDSYRKGNTDTSNLLIDIFESGNKKLINVALEYYESKNNFIKILPIMEKVAEDGNDFIAFSLTKFYSVQSANFNKDKALKFCKLAADNGNCDACILLGDWYKKGEFVKKDLSQAAYYYEKSKAKLTPENYCLIAQIAEQENRFAIAKWYYELALFHKYEKALFPLAELYYKHFFSEENYEITYDYYARAEQFEPDNKKVLGMLHYLNGFFYLNKIYIVQIKDIIEAKKQLQQALELGIEEAGLLLNEYLLEENEFEKGKKYFFEFNYELAIQYFHKSLKYIDNAKYMLGLCYDQGLGIDQNYMEAYELFSKLDDNPEALFMLGKYFENGYGVNINYFEADKYYRKSYEYGKKESAFALGEMYYRISGVECFLKSDNNSRLEMQRIIDWYNCAPEYLGKGKLNLIYVIVYERIKQDSTINKKIRDEFFVKNNEDAFKLLKVAIDYKTKDAYELFALYHEKGYSDCSNRIEELEIAVNYYKLASEYNLNDYSDKIKSLNKEIEIRKNPLTKKQSLYVTGALYGIFGIINLIIKSFISNETLSHKTLGIITLTIYFIIIIYLNYYWHNRRKELKEYKEKHNNKFM